MVGEGQPGGQILKCIADRRAPRQGPKVAAERLGHADATLFMNLYSHVTPTMQREAANRIGQALFGDA